MSEIERLADAAFGANPTRWASKEREAVRAMLRALREPSEAMVKAGETACEALNNGGCRTAAEDAACAWRAMIDAVLREEVPA